MVIFEMKPFGIKSHDKVERRPFQYFYSITDVRPLRTSKAQEQVSIRERRQFYQGIV